MEKIRSLPPESPRTFPHAREKAARKVHAPEISADELASWILQDDAEMLVISKPAGVVCHPSKAGPTSSLVGAIRVHRALEHPHLVSRLDRETSGVVLVAKTSPMARRLQMAIARRLIGKSYLAIVHGEAPAEAKVDQPLGDDPESPVAIKTAILPGGRKAVTVFTCVSSGRGFSLVRAVPETGRKHQIRAHAQWLGYPILGDKLYGPDPRHYLEFVETGWTEKLAAALIHPRQALHCCELDLRPAGLPQVFRAPLAADLRDFCSAHGLAIPVES